MRKTIVIIGSGLGGTLLANELSEDHDVTVLEIGPEHGIQYPALINENKQLAHINTFCHGAGGGSNLWHNGLIPIDPNDVSDSPFRQALRDSASYIDRAAARLHMDDASFSAEYAKSRQIGDELGQEIGEFSDGVDSLIYPKRYSPLSLLNSVRTHFDVSDIRFRLAGSGVSEVTFSVGNAKHRLPSDCLIISSGSFGTPIVLKRLLESAGRDHRDVGTGLIDHPMGFVGKVRFPGAISDTIQKFSLADAGQYEFRSAVRLKSECGQYTACAFFRPAVTMTNKLDTYIYKSMLGASTGKKRLRNALSPKILHPDIIAEIVSHLCPVSIPTRTYSVLFMGEQRERRNRVSGSERELHVDWSISQQELAVYNSMIRRLMDMLAAPADEMVVNSSLDGDWLWSGAHHSGTTMMGRNGDGTINGSLRVNGLDNAFVCDASVIQEHSYANTGLTIGQLALRLADHVREV